MNIFVFNTDPVLAARDHCDRHVVKMIVEAAQMLSTVHHEHGNPPPKAYRPTHAHHPCTVWAGESVANYMWLVEHAFALAEEYTRRYDRTHKTKAVLRALISPPAGVPDGPLTPFAQAMPEEYRDPDDPVNAYRDYFMGEKRHIAHWRGDTPAWWIP